LHSQTPRNESLDKTWARNPSTPGTETVDGRGFGEFI